MIYIIMGVSGAGKSFIGQKLADKLGIPFYDADDFHPPSNVQKMETGKPLNDADRRPWLEALRKRISQWDEKDEAVLACSALKSSYRNILASEHTSATFIYLKGSKKLIARRLKKRTNHFMPESLLDSQFKALEEPEDAIMVGINRPAEKIVEEIISKIA